MLRRAELTALAQHPSWPVLDEVLSQKAERIKNRIAVRAISRGVSLEDQAYERGYLMGMSYVLSVPENAERRLEDLFGDDEGEVASG
jgi:hypothetical protein